jgi:HSP20 family protein
MNAPLTTPMATPLARRDLFGSLFDDFFNDAWMRPAWMPASMASLRAEMPAVARARMDVVDKGNAFEITVDLPGVKKEDINVSVEGDRVAISAEMTSEKEVKEGDKLLHTERMATSYARNFELPAEVTEAGAEALYENGVLKLTLPKRAPTTSRRLAIS